MITQASELPKLFSRDGFVVLCCFDLYEIIHDIWCRHKHYKLGSWMVLTEAKDVLPSQVF